MLVVIGALFFSMKALVSVESGRARARGCRLCAGRPSRRCGRECARPSWRACSAAFGPALLRTGLAYVALGTTLFLLAHLTGA